MKLNLIITLTLFTFSCKQESEKKDPDLIPTSVINNPQTIDKSDKTEKKIATMAFEKTEYDFGKIKEGDTGRYSFKFKNTGNTVLVISNATASCGCTVPYFPKKPILQGGEEEIRITFDSKDRPGSFRKEIIIMANTLPSENKIYISGEVVK